MRRAIVLFTFCVILALSHQSWAIVKNLPLPEVKPFSDHQDWMLVKDLIYTIGETETQIIVPAGFVSDFASVPGWAQAISFGKLTPHGEYSRAAIVHDFLYWAQPCTRLQADNLFMIAMKESGVDETTRGRFYNAVRSDQVDKVWKRHAKERKDGLFKVIPSELRDLPPITWQDYRKALAKNPKAKDPMFGAVDYCGLGDTTDIPPKKK
jgi:hypothetical protein